MALVAGTRIGSYEILGSLGAGGMGEVYRAHDSNLGRQVAIKILPERFAHDRDRLARFEREARTLASLDHPNVAVVHGLETQDGLRALVMELVEGPTLYERITTGRLPLDEVLPIARQIADALEAAHAHGIIHRDLKPTNIKLRADGTVKVLDFGLAKVIEAVDAAAVTDSLTITAPDITAAGLILGTAAYMAPEQVKGHEADKRSDIWAFGAVLYELLTGRRPFDSPGVAETFASILTKEPDWSALPADTPPAVRRLLRRALTKDRRSRLADIADARIEIDEATRSEPDTSTTSRDVSRERLAWALSVVLAGVLGVAVPFVLSPSDTPATLRQARVDIVTPSTSESFALSPNGEYLVFVADSEGGSVLWLRRLDRETAQPLPDTQGATQPFWHPDSTSIGFFAGGYLKRIGINGGMPVRLAPAAPGAGGTWNADDVILFASTATSPLLRISANGGTPVAQTSVARPGQVAHGFPTFLPGGREFLFFVTAVDASQGIYVGSLDSPTTTQLVSADRPPALYMSTDRGTDWLLYSQQSTLLARRFDVANKTLRGDPERIADSLVVGSPAAAYGRAAFSATPNGLIAYRTGQGSLSTQLTWFASGKPDGVLGPPDDALLRTPEISPDGQVAVSRTVTNNTDIFLMPRRLRLTFHERVDQYPVFSPDGMWVAFASLRKGVGDLYRQAIHDRNLEELLLESPHQKNPDDWSPDGQYLIYNEEDPVTLRDLKVLPLVGNRTPFVFLRTKFEEHRAQFRPRDGRFVAYVSNEPGQHEIFVRSFPPTDAQWQISSGGGVQPRWSREGNEIYYLAPDGKMMATAVTVRNGAIETGETRVLFQTRTPGGGTVAYTRPQFDVSSDGRFVVNTVVDEVGGRSIRLLLNWKPQLAD